MRSETIRYSKNSTEYVETLAGIAYRFDLHMVDYQHIFRNRIKVFHSKAEIYTKGVLLSHQWLRAENKPGKWAGFMRIACYIEKRVVRWDSSVKLKQSY